MGHQSIAENLTLETERLHLIPFQRSDTDLFLDLNTDPFIRKYLWDDQIISEPTATDILLQNVSHFRHEKYGLWKIRLKSRSEIIGFTGLWYFFDEPQPQLICAILEPFTRQGYASEASMQIIHYAFNELGFEYIIAATDEPHEASQSAALSLGMSFVEKRIEKGKPTLFFKIENSQN